jgi:hypothetical protein
MLRLLCYRYIGVVAIWEQYGTLHDACSDRGPSENASIKFYQLDSIRQLWYITDAECSQLPPQPFLQPIFARVTRNKQNGSTCNQYVTYYLTLLTHLVVVGTVALPYVRGCQCGRAHLQTWWSGPSWRSACYVEW